MKYYDQLMEELVIDSFDAGVESIHMRQPMHLAFGDITARPSGVVRLNVSNSEGSRASGLGEGATLPKPLFTDDSGANIAENTRKILASLPSRGSCVSFIENIQRYTFSDGGKYPTARMAVEMALLDAHSRLCQKPIRDMLGIKGIKEVPYGKSIGGQQTDEIIDQAEKAIANNAKKIKLKVMPDNFDQALVAINTLADTHADLDLMVDANGGFDVNDVRHLEMIETLDDCDLVMIEEPVSRNGYTKGIEAVYQLRDSLKKLQTPICLDDCLTDYDTCVVAVDEDLADVINIKPGRIGSILLSLSLIDYCSDKNKQVMIGGMFEATPGRCVTTLLGAYCLAKGFRIPGDLSLAQERLAGDISIKSIHQLSYGPNGGILLPTGLGWGYTSE